MSDFKALIKKVVGDKKSTKNINDGLQHYQQSIDKYFKKLKNMHGIFQIIAEPICSMR